MEKRYGSLLRHTFVADVMAKYFVKDDTDLNDHAALHLRVRDDTGVTAQVCLSFVSNFALLFRFNGQSLVYAEVVDESTPGLRLLERDILALLQKHRFKLLTKSDAAAPIEMELFNTDKSDARVYHAVVSDDGIVPQVLL